MVKTESVIVFSLPFANCGTILSENSCTSSLLYCKRMGKIMISLFCVGHHRSTCRGASYYTNTTRLFSDGGKGGGGGGSKPPTSRA